VHSTIGIMRSVLFRLSLSNLCYVIALHVLNNNVLDAGWLGIEKPVQLIDLDHCRIDESDKILN
jgi:hypothetical protein